ncbi:MAG: cobalt ECF transporter T component CbiQ [Thermodesulfobacteriota bacterium]
MADITTALLDLGRLDRLAYRDTPMHRLDPRAKLLTTLIFLVCVVSFDRYAVAGLLPFLLFPVVVIALAGLPAGFLLKKVLMVAPLALLVGAANPWFDPDPLLRLGRLTFSAGWVSYLSILLRFVLTVTAALALIATTGFHGVCVALRRIGVPAVMTVQLLLAYRYLFVLASEGARMVRARSLRSFQRRGEGLTAYGSLVGHLLLRTVERAQRIHRAMLARGFAGELHSPAPLRFRTKDTLFLFGWAIAFLFFRLINLPQWLGRLVTAG